MVTPELTSAVCCVCGIKFAMPTAFYWACSEDSAKSFFCPSGHKQHFAESRVDRLSRENERLRNANAALIARNDNLRRAEAAQRGAKTRAIRRAQKEKVTP